jgi:hypothetical protein
MIGKCLFLIIFLLIQQLFPVFSAVYYVAPNGSDTHTGSIDQPFATIRKAQEVVSPGDTVYLRGGTYKMIENQIAKKEKMWAYVTCLDKNGTLDKRINYWAYPGEKPVFDYSDVKPAGYRVIAFHVLASWIHIKGLEIVGVQVTIQTHTQSECFENRGSNNIYELLRMHDGQAIGFYLVKGSNNLVLNCDAYQNWDYTSENGKGGNTDGFGCHPSNGSTDNVFRGCRAWFNSDDGYDCIGSAESVTFENCWAFYNGYSPSFAGIADGNGFKAGGYGKRTVNELPDPIPGHVVKFCLAVRNKANGFYSNHHMTGSTWLNNIAYRNKINYNMLNRLDDNVTEVAGYGHILKNNISYKGNKDTLNINRTRCELSNNSFDTGIVFTDSDFVNLDEALLVAPRQADGSLPDAGFMQLKPDNKTKYQVKSTK